jgi:hypothetical protein
VSRPRTWIAAALALVAVLVLARIVLHQAAEDAKPRGARRAPTFTGPVYVNGERQATDRVEMAVNVRSEFGSSDDEHPEPFRFDRITATLDGLPVELRVDGPPGLSPGSEGADGAASERSTWNYRLIVTGRARRSRPRLALRGCAPTPPCDSLTIPLEIDAGGTVSGQLR